MEALYEIGCSCGRFILSSAFLMLIYWFLLRKNASFIFSRIYLLSIPFLSLAMAFLSIEIGEKETSVVYVESGSYAAASSDTAVNTAISDGIESSSIADNLPAMSLGEVLTAVYLLVVALLFVHLAYGVSRILLLRGKSQKHVFGRFCFYRSAGIDSPFSFMTSVYLPESTSGSAERLVVKHELAHIRCLHYVDILVVETVVRLLWFNPVLWAVLVELRNVHEFQADSKVLETGENVHVYQTLLLEEVLSSRFGLANGFNHSFIRRRFLSMKDFASRRLSALRASLTGVSVLLLFAVFCFTEGEAEVVYKLRAGLPASNVEVPARSNPSSETGNLDTAASESVAGEAASADASADMSAAEQTDLMPVKKLPADSPASVAAIAPAPVDTAVAKLADRKRKEDKFVPLEEKKLNDGIPVMTYAKGAISSAGYKNIRDEFFSMEVPFYIVREKKETRLVLLSYVTSEEQTYFFSSNLFIVDNRTGDRYKVRRVLNYNLDERFRLRHYKNQVLEFTLIFPPLPKSVRNIDVIEQGTTKRWNFRNVDVKDVEREAVKVIL